MVVSGLFEAMKSISEFWVVFVPSSLWVMQVTNPGLAGAGWMLNLDRRALVLVLFLLKSPATMMVSFGYLKVKLSRISSNFA
jgi:hypothetical protein